MKLLVDDLKSKVNTIILGLLNFYRICNIIFCACYEYVWIIVSSQFKYYSSKYLIIHKKVVGLYWILNIQDFFHQLDTDDYTSIRMPESYESRYWNSHYGSHINKFQV